MNRQRERYNPISAYDFSEPTFADPAYMRGDKELTEERYSNNDSGGTLYQDSHEIRQRGATRNRGNDAENISVNYPYYTGGTLLHPEFLPPVKTYHLQ
jgi:hypothetical protein